MNKTTDQVRTPPNPSGKGGFADNPQNRNPGGWKKEDTPRFKLEQMMKLSESELVEIINDVAKPLFEHKLATALRDGNWQTIKEMMQEVYGKPKESVEHSNPDGNLMPTVRIVDERNKT